MWGFRRFEPGGCACAGSYPPAAINRAHFRALENCNLRPEELNTRAGCSRIWRRLKPLLIPHGAAALLDAEKSAQPTARCYSRIRRAAIRNEQSRDQPRCRRLFYAATRQPRRRVQAASCQAQRNTLLRDAKLALLGTTKQNKKWVQIGARKNRAALLDPASAANRRLF